jgi:hypothetical protein
MILMFVSFHLVTRLLDAYDQCDSITAKENLLSDLRYGNSNRRIGPTISKFVYQLCCLEDYSLLIK